MNDSVIIVVVIVVVGVFAAAVFLVWRSRYQPLWKAKERPAERTVVIKDESEKKD